MDGPTDTGMKFEILGAAPLGRPSARLGRLTVPGRRVLETPDFFAVTSRGAVPHVTPDNLSRHIQAGGAYLALEDFIEKSQNNPARTAPIFKTPASNTKPLHSFAAVPPSTVTVLGPRRFPAVPAPMGNGHDSISVFTSTGFRSLTTRDYESATEILKPDIAVPLADLTPVSVTPKSKRALRMAERTEDWLAQWFRRLTQDDVLRPSNISVFAPVLPVTYSMQWEYLSRIAEDHLSSVSGLAIYDADLISDLGDYSALLPLPRLSFDVPQNPHQVLAQVALGVDIFLLPFLNAASDAGIALTFTFPPPSSPSSPPRLPLGIDMSSPEHRASLAPLREGCGCYTCVSHHRAYVHHLLRTREMLGWTLLQIHNHRALSDFFCGVRSCLGPATADATTSPPPADDCHGDEAEAKAERATQRGADGSFPAQRIRFAAVYEEHLPAGTGDRPRARGYHFKSEAGGEKRNRRAWGRLKSDGAVVEGSEVGDVT